MNRFHLRRMLLRSLEFDGVLCYIRFLKWCLQCYTDYVYNFIHVPIITEYQYLTVEYLRVSNINDEVNLLGKRKQTKICIHILIKSQPAQWLSKLSQWPEKSLQSQYFHITRLIFNYKSYLRINFDQWSITWAKF